MRYWKSLSTQQLGRYGEYLARLLFAKSGMDVYLPEVDDKGIDLVVRSQAGHFFEVQCKAVRQLNYWYVAKSKFPISAARYLCLLVFIDEGNDDPDVFLIPSCAWETPNNLFVDRAYEGKKSAPEWGLQFSKKNMQLLEPFRVFDTVIETPEMALRPRS